MQGQLTSRRTVLAMIGAAVALPRAGRAAGIERIAGRAFGTSWSLTADAAGLPPEIGPAIAALFDEVDREMSPWREDSALSRFNAAPAGAFRASEDLVAVTDASLSLARASDGAFDPSVGPLVARWGFGPVREGGRPDWRGLSARHGHIAKVRDDLTLDLCGIAKGHALDRACDLVRSSGVEGFLFDLGGELRAAGLHPSGRPWRVGVESLPGAVISLGDGQAVATSGLAHQSYSIGDRTWGHVIDPKAERPASGALGSVTVLGPDAMTADGWATALFAAGETDGPALAREQRLSALFVTGEGPETRVIETGAIRAAIP